LLADLISGELPYLRRYARALLGTRSAGDAAVETMLETKMMVFLSKQQTSTQRKDLFRALDETIMEELSDGKLNQEVAKILRTMTTDERRAVMLTAVEGSAFLKQPKSCARRQVLSKKPSPMPKHR
jgi:DNA-directed RNA polymerase specialized sigma24 family protein